MAFTCSGEPGSGPVYVGDVTRSMLVFVSPSTFTKAIIAYPVQVQFKNGARPDGGSLRQVSRARSIVLYSAASGMPEDAP
jgi:small nuclear ribonucleoprotein (snRNP)-like protein